MQPARLPLLLPSLTAALVAALATPAAATEPWADATPSSLRQRIPWGPWGLELGAELRAQGTHVDELDLGGLALTTFEQRLRVDAALDDGQRLRLVVGLDALDGVPWGATAGAPDTHLTAPRSGLGVLDVDYLGPAAPDDPAGYGLTLVPAPGVVLRRAYGEAWFPFGRLRFGRQAAATGITLLGTDGEGRTSRFGVEHGGDLVDRVELLVRPFAPPESAATADEPGLGITLAYDRLALDAPEAATAARAGATLRLLEVRPTVEQVFDARAAAHAVWRSDGSERGSQLEGLIVIRTAGLTLGFDGVLVAGASARLARSLEPLVAASVAETRVRAWGTRSVLRWDTSRVTAMLELDTASGDAEPDPRTDQTRFAFPRDAHVGLLLFDQVLAYATARAAAAGAATLAAAGLPPDGAAALATHGAFTSAVALFPQLDLRPRRDLLLRAGVLFAWAPEPLVDPVRSLAARGPDAPLAEAPAATATATVGVRGGEAGGYYGTELDARVRYTYRERCDFDLEGAVLAPGSALADGSGEAATATLVAARATLAF